MKQPLMLRGHHIDTFALYYHAVQNGFAQEKYDTLCTDPELAKYTPGFWSKVEGIWKRIIEHPRMSIQAVNSLDSVCRMPCPRLKLKDPQCTAFNEDRSALKEFGLKQNKIYTGQELIEKIIQYEKKTGCASPRSKMQDKDMMSIFKELSQVFG